RHADRRQGQEQEPEVEEPEQGRQEHVEGPEGGQGGQAGQVAPGSRSGHKEPLVRVLLTSGFCFSGPGWVRTTVASAAVLQTASFGHSDTDPRPPSIAACPVLTWCPRLTCRRCVTPSTRRAARTPTA